MLYNNLTLSTTASEVILLLHANFHNVILGERDRHFKLTSGRIVLHHRYCWFVGEMRSVRRKTAVSRYNVMQPRSSAFWTTLEYSKPQDLSKQISAACGYFHHMCLVPYLHLRCFKCCHHLYLTVQQWLEAEKSHLQISYQISRAELLEMDYMGCSGINSFSSESQWRFS